MSDCDVEKPVNTRLFFIFLHHKDISKVYLLLIAKYNSFLVFLFIFYKNKMSQTEFFDVFCWEINIFIFTIKDLITVTAHIYIIRIK